jgi:hypothetical protein
MTKKKMEIDNLKVVIELYKSITDIGKTLEYSKKFLENIIAMVSKHNTSDALLSQKLDTQKEVIDKLVACTDEIKQVVNSLNIQLDFKEHKDFLKNKFTWKQFWNIVITFCINAKWVFFVLFMIALIWLIVMKTITLHQAINAGAKILGN